MSYIFYKVNFYLIYTFLSCAFFNLIYYNNEIIFVIKNVNNNVVKSVQELLTIASVKF